MPGTLTIDQAATFAAALFMGCTQKMKFQSSEPDMSATGERKWSCQIAVTYHPEYGMKPVSEVLTVSVTSGTDPGVGIMLGTSVEFDALKCGFSAPERGQNDRIRGGRPFYMASGVRATSGQNGHRQPVQAAKSE
jgi:hypothetical protein